MQQYETMKPITNPHRSLKQTTLLIIESFDISEGKSILPLVVVSATRIIRNINFPLQQPKLGYQHSLSQILQFIVHQSIVSAV
jgi:hypothetical protein